MERYDSVWEGLKCIKESGYVFIHDGARPCISQKLINDCYEAVVEDGACIAAVPVKDTIKIADSEGYAAKHRTGIHCGRFRHHKYLSMI